MDDGWNETLLWLTFRADRMGEDFPHYRRILDFIAAVNNLTPLLDRVAELEVNDARYRWLRDRWGRLSENYDGEGPVITSVFTDEENGWEVDPRSLDAAIDRGRGQEET